MSQRLLSFLMLVLLVFTAGCTAASAAPQGEAVAQASAEARTISVTGNAEVLVVPDEVLLTLGVETWDPDLTKAKAQNDQIIKEVLQIADSFAIDPKYVQTDYVHIEPSYENYERHRITGYYVRKTVDIRLKDISKFEDLLSQTLEAGVNYVQRVEFRTSELRKHRDQARALAIEAAQEKATAMAENLDQQIGQPLAVTENWSQWWYPYNAWWV